MWIIKRHSRRKTRQDFKVIMVYIMSNIDRKNIRYRRITYAEK